MHPEPSALLEAAHAIVAEQITRLRALHTSAQHQLARLEAEVRRSERQLDEVLIQARFASERGQVSATTLAERQRRLRAAHEGLTQEYEQMRRALRQLDQLVRQIDMSSATLRGGGEGETSDPWVQALRSQVIMGREEERVRLAREVHDGPAQVLANALMGLERCQMLLADRKLDRLQEMLGQLSDNAREGLRELRGFIADLRPGKLEEHGLGNAIREYVQRYRDTLNVPITLDLDPLPRLPAEAEIVLYRIVQESLQNARKHAPGAPIHIVLTWRNERLVLLIRDEGPGFDLREVARRAGRESWGLTSMRERAELIGASFVVTTRPGHGAEVAVSLPLRGEGTPSRPL